jgi:hypothetical protein
LWPTRPRLQHRPRNFRSLVCVWLPAWEIPAGSMPARATTRDFWSSKHWRNAGASTGNGKPRATAARSSTVLAASCF